MLALSPSSLSCHWSVFFFSNYNLKSVKAFIWTNSCKLNAYIYRMSCCTLHIYFTPSCCLIPCYLRESLFGCLCLLCLSTGLGLVHCYLLSQLFHVLCQMHYIQILMTQWISQWLSQTRSDCEKCGVWLQPVHLLQFLLLGLVLLSSSFSSDVFHGFHIRAQIFTESLCEEEMQHQVVYLRLHLGNYREDMQETVPQIS